MVIELQRFTCLKCKRVFDADLVSSAPVAVFVAAVKAIRCPACGASSRYVAFGGAHKDPPPLSSRFEVRAAWWLARGDVGTSSKTIWCAMQGVPFSGEDFPHDPADFGRCIALIEMVPEWRPRLPEMAVKYPWWRPFIDRWEELETTYKEESPSGICERLYAAMREPVNEGAALRRSAAGLS